MKLSEEKPEGSIFILSGRKCEPCGQLIIFERVKTIDGRAKCPDCGGDIWNFLPGDEI